MKKKNWFALTICIILIVSIVSGCSGNPSGTVSQNPKSKQTEQTPINTSDGEESDILWQDMVVATNSEFHINSDMWIFKEMEKIHNMNFHIEVYGTDQWNERKSLLFAANELPDVLMSGLTNNEVITYSQAGQIIPITDLLKEHAPNYMRCLEKYPDGKKLYAPDGNMYGMAGTFTGGSAETPGARCFINATWASALGKEMPHTYDEFYDLLTAFKNSDPKGTGEEPLKYKKVIQTVTYAPHFISTVVMAAMVTLFLSPSAGFINKFIEALGYEPVNFMSKAKYFPHIYVWSGVWQHIGWNSIIYVAGLSGIDYNLHEAAMIDGATRLQRIWHINLPGIIPMIVIQLILTMGGMLGSDFEKVLLLQNPSIMETADVLSTYTYRIGIQGGKFSLSSAVGLFGSVVNFILIIITNFICSKLGETSLW